MTEFINWAVNYLLFPLELLIACVLYMLPLEKRRNFPLRVILGILACLALAAFIPRSLLRYLLEYRLGPSSRGILVYRDGLDILHELGYRFEYSLGSRTHAARTEN